MKIKQLVCMMKKEVEIDNSSVSDSSLNLNEIVRNHFESNEIWEIDENVQMLFDLNKNNPVK